MGEVEVVGKLFFVVGFLVDVHNVGKIGVCALDFGQDALFLSFLQVVLGAVVLVLRQHFLGLKLLVLYLHGVHFGLLAFLLAHVGLFHSEESRPEVLIVHRGHVLQLRRELCEVFVLQSVLRGDPLGGVIGQQLGEDVLEVGGTRAGQELLQADALLLLEVDFHVGGLGLEAVEDFGLGSAEDVVDAVDLVELVFAGEEGLLCVEFEQDAAVPPDVHLLVVVAVGHEALGGPVPAGGDVVGVGGRGVAALARAQIGDFGEIALDEDILGFDIAVEDALAVHEVDGGEDLEHVEFDAGGAEGVAAVVEAFVQVHVHELKNQGELACVRGRVPLGSS